MDVFELVAKLGLDTSEYEEGLKGAESNASKLGGALKSGLGTAAKIGTAALATAATAAGALAKQSVDAYKEYEQLEGGIETLFGSAAPKVMANAERAFQSAGQSMNDYMETSIQSAAALINSLGGDQAKAADLMDMSIVDMADNVNKMGTTMEGVQNAYRGFSRGNFTMLDNLALGFAGTKEGMQELLDKAKELSGIEYNINSYADIVQAIHIVQEEMGIAGTTAKEGAETISGSIEQLKSAWTNLVSGLANPNADLGLLIDNVVASAETALNNLVPAIEHALIGIASFIEKAAPIIADKLPGVIEKILPSLLNAANTIINALIKAMPSLIDAVIKSIEQNPEILTTLGPILMAKLASGLLGNLDMLKPVGEAISKKLGSGISTSLPKTLSSTFSSIGSFLTADIGEAVAAGGATAGATVGTAIVGSIVAFLGGAEIGKKIGAVLFPEDAEMYEEYSGIKGTFIMLKDFFVTLGEEIGYGLSDVWAKLSEFFSLVGEKWNEFWTNVYEFFKPVIESIQYTSGIIFNAISEKIHAKLDEIKAFWTNVWTVLKIVFEPIIESIKEKLNAFWEKTTEIFNSIMNFVQEKIFPLMYSAQDKIGEVIDGIKQKFSDGVEMIKDIFNGLGDFFKGLFEKAKTWGSDLMESFKEGILGKRDQIAGSIRLVGDIIKANLGHSHPTEGPLADDYKWMPDMMDLFASGINSSKKDVVNSVNSLTNDMSDLIDFSQPQFQLAGGYGIMDSGSSTTSDGDYGGDIVTTITDALMNMQLVVNIGNRPIEAMITTAQQKTNYRSGGR